VKRRILFVDDEPNVLSGLRRMLRSMREEWDFEFAGSGREALEVMQRTAVEVIVTDMRMPGMDGSQLLDEVLQRHPQVVRIVLSGQSDTETVLRSVRPTHQFLSKPCDAETLKATVARACALRDLMAEPSLKDLVSRISTLPSMPSLYLEVVKELRCRHDRKDPTTCQLRLLRTAESCRVTGAGRHLARAGYDQDARTYRARILSV
jgi:DNA-binding NtrC family response regulator